MQKEAERNLERLGEGAQVGERRDRQTAFDLAQPADRAAELVGDSGERQAARLAQGSYVAGEKSAERRSLGFGGSGHRSLMKFLRRFSFCLQRVKISSKI